MVIADCGVETSFCSRLGADRSLDIRHAIVSKNCGIAARNISTTKVLASRESLASKPKCWTVLGRFAQDRIPIALTRNRLVAASRNRREQLKPSRRAASKFQKRLGKSKDEVRQMIEKI
jgi:hypothetical protein